MSDRNLSAPLQPLPFSSPRWTLDAAGRMLRKFAGSEGILILSVPAPLAADPSVLPELAGGDGFVYLPPAGPAFAGAGSVIELTASGPGRFAALAAQASAAAARCSSEGFGTAAEPALFFGGFAFSPGSAGDGIWRGFGDAAFSLPRWLYRRAGEAASLSLAVSGEEILLAEQRETWLGRVRAALAALATPPAAAPLGGLQLEPPDALEAERRIASALELIRSG
jgi:hypothetical protein